MPVTPYMNNSGGLNITSSPLFMDDGQATGQSWNYEYLTTGAFSKVLCPTLLNAVADTQLTTLGLGMHHNAITDVRTLIRAAGTKLQTVNTTTGAIANIADDTTAANTNFLTSTTQPVVSEPFNTLVGGTQLWMVGGGMPSVYGYTGSQITQNGCKVPTGGITATVNTHNGGTCIPGSYYYAVQFRKLSTQTYSNVVLDEPATTVNTDDTVTINLAGITNIDTKLYDQIIVWRSAFSGSKFFTTGSIIAQLASTATSYVDLGPSIADSQNTPRAGNTILDNSVLPAGVITSIATFKQRLVVAIGSSVYLSDLNKPESWPLENVITVTTGGPITNLGSVGVNSEYTTGADEYLCIWKDRELWDITGQDPSTWALSFVDKTGCAGPALAVAFNGYITWMTYNGIYLWNGTGNPSRISRPINILYGVDGDIDKSTLYQGVCAHYEKGRQVIWRLPHRTKGKNKFSIKMDTALTSLAAAAAANLNNPEVDGTFSFDYDTNSYYGMCSFKTGAFDELLIVGDNAGFVYTMFTSSNVPVMFDYETKPLDMGNPGVLKKFKRVLVYVEKLTTSDLTLYYWADYRVRDEYRSTVIDTLTPSKGTQPALYDVALWDQALFDDYLPDIGIVEFNLHNYENNAEGISLKLRFEQLQANSPVRIHGFEVEWDAIGNIPKPTGQI